MSSVCTELLDRITSRRARVGVVGLGYVGLPLAVELARAGFHTVGIDVDAAKAPALDVMGVLRARGADVSCTDPFVPRLSARSWAGDCDLRSVPIMRETLATVDCAVIVTNHRTVDHDAIADWADLVVDARNTVKQRAPHVFRLGAPAPALVPDGAAEAVVAQAG